MMQPALEAELIEQRGFAVTALGALRRAEPDMGIPTTDHIPAAGNMINATLTLGELWGMDGEPVWVSPVAFDG